MFLFALLVHAGLLTIILLNFRYLDHASPARKSSLSPSLSVLIPARNEEKNLQRLLPSLLSQSYPDYEVIIYDDGSEDKTPAILAAESSVRLRTLRGEGPPPGWIGKVHALYQATRVAEGERYLFLDADVALNDPQALDRLSEAFESLPEDAVMTGLPRLRGGGMLLVSLVPHALLAGLPWPLVRRFRSPSLGALNGQCWMIRASDYHRFEPHAHLPAEVLEDVKIGRYLKRMGMTPVLRDVQEEVTVFMYNSLAEAWKGFRKNAYLIMGGTLPSFTLVFAFSFIAYVYAPLRFPWLLLSLIIVKFLTDHRQGLPFWISLLAPLSFLLGSVLQLDSMVHHLLGRATWKGRNV